MLQEVEADAGQTTSKLRYLALGDSYTVGEGVDEQHAWPQRLANLLDAQGYSLAIPTVLAKTGWTTEELAEELAARKLPNDFDLVSLSIGVNDQYRGYPVADYPERFLKLMRKALSYGARHACVFAVSIPDYGITPFAAEKELDPDRIASELDQYNRQAKGIAGRLGIPWVDVTALSRERGSEPQMLAEDGLHPSGEMYRQWVEAILPVIKERLPKA